MTSRVTLILQGHLKRLTLLVTLLLIWALLGTSRVTTGAKPPTTDISKSLQASNPYKLNPKSIPRKKCMECHPEIARLLRTKGAAHGRVACRQCHLQFHVYFPGKTDYKSILPKCTRCHDHPHGSELTNCSSCHTEAHSPLDIPATVALAKGCHVCHPKYDKEIKTYITKHTELYCTACHHTRHGHIPKCLECHQPHKGIFPSRTQPFSLMKDCLKCHPPHKALNVVYSNKTPNFVCALCHREAYEMLVDSHTKHSKLHCTRCHPSKHKTIKRCRQCHGQPHPQAMFKRFGSCGKCHSVAHSLVK